eukprot:g15385.t1
MTIMRQGDTDGVACFLALKKHYGGLNLIRFEEDQEKLYHSASRRCRAHADAVLLRLVGCCVGAADKVFAGVNNGGWLMRKGFQMAYTAQTDAVRNKKPRIERWDKKIFIPLRTEVGREIRQTRVDKVRFVISGAAPCPPWLFEFLQVVTGAAVCQGYGMTENCACCTLQVPDDGNAGHVGPPALGTEIKLVDVPEMNYTSKDKPHPRGEIVVKSLPNSQPAPMLGSFCAAPTNFLGYFKQEDGWLYTGDIGRWNEDGTLSIIDRRKNIFKLAQGEYIAVEKVEDAYKSAAPVNQIWVFGNSYKSVVVAVVVPDAMWLRKFCTGKGWWKSDSHPGTPDFLAEFKSMLSDKSRLQTIKAAVLESMNAAATEAKLMGFEKVKAIHLEKELEQDLTGFSVANDCLTPTFKLKRPQLKNRYLEDVKQLYTELGEAPKPEEAW